MYKSIGTLLSIILVTLVVGACSSPEEKAGEFVQSGNQLLDDGNLAKSEIEYKNALQINQNLPDAWYGLARIYERKQQWRAAYGALNKIRELAPGHIEGRIKLAQMLLASNQLDQALNDTREIVGMAPDNARAKALMAAVHFRLENIEGAREAVAESLRLAPGNGEAILVLARLQMAEKKYAEAIEVLDRAIAAEPENLSMYLMKLQAFQEMDDSRAVEGIYRDLVDRFPQNPTFRAALARHYIGTENLDAAETILTQSANLGPDTVVDKSNLVRFKQKFRSTAAAIELTRSYIESDQDENQFRFLLAELVEQDGDLQQARSVYRDIIESENRQADSLEARYRLAQLELRAGNRAEAEALLDEVLAQDSANEEGLLLKAGVQIEAGNYDDAIVNLRTVLRDQPDSARALGLLGQAYDANGSTELALEAYSSAYRLNPGLTAIANRYARTLIRQRQFSTADEVLQGSISRGNRSVNALRLLTEVKLSLNEWDLAERLARQLQEYEGQEAVSQQILGIVYQGREDRDASIEAFKRAHELAPASVQPIVSLVRTYLGSGQKVKAQQFLESVLAVDEDNVTAHYLLGQLAVLDKEPAVAIEHFERIVAIDPRAEIGYRGLAAVYLRNREFGKAEEAIKNGLAEMPGLPVLSIQLASVYERQQRHDEAIAIYQDLLDRNPQLIIARNNLASLLTDYRDDQASWDRARSLSADLRASRIPQFRDTYAWAAVKSGINVEEAIVILEKIVQESGEIDVYHYHLGEAYRKKGDKDSAIASLNRAIEHSRPDSSIAEWARESLSRIN